MKLRHGNCGGIVDLREVVQRYAEGLAAIDDAANVERANPRTGEFYLPGVKSLAEEQVVKALNEWWSATHPADFVPGGEGRTGVKYPDLPRAKCDHVFSTDEDLALPEWAVEVKNIVLVGNNGKRNDFAVTKVLSPFLKDRSLLHDAVRLRAYPLARRHAVVGYSFGYDVESCERALRMHPSHAEAIRQISVLCRDNGGDLTIRPLLDFADGILLMRGLVQGTRTEVHFDAWRHPCGGKGVVFGWEVRRPEREALFDPRHPW